MGEEISSGKSSAPRRGGSLIYQTDYLSSEEALKSAAPEKKIKGG